MKTHAIAAVDAARLAVSVERVLAEALLGDASGESSMALSGVTPKRGEAAPAPARQRRPRRARGAAVETPDDAQATFDLAPEADPEPGEPELGEEPEESSAAAPPVVEEAEEEPAAAAPVVVSEPAPIEMPAETAPETAPETAHEAEAPEDAEPRRRKRPPRPAHRRRAARVAAIEAMLVEGEVPPPYDEEEG